MNKQKIDELIPKAYEAIGSVGIATKDGKVPSTFRSYISSFGAAITMGSLRAAVAFFSKKGSKSKEPKELLMDAIFLLIKDDSNEKNLLNYVCTAQNEAQVKEDILNAAIAIKLALNMFDIQPSEKKADGTQGESNEQ